MRFESDSASSQLIMHKTRQSEDKTLPPAGGFYLIYSFTLVGNCYLNLELQLSADCVHHLCSLHCAGAFVAFPYHLLTQVRKREKKKVT